jgi:hypothetical protein
MPQGGIKMKKMIVLLSILVLLFAVTAVYAGPNNGADDPFGGGSALFETQINQLKDPILKCPIYSSPRDGYLVPKCPVD